MRATVSDFGPQLLAKILESNETQEQSLQLVFHYADQKGLALLDLSDLRALLTFLESDAGKSELEGIGGLASSTVGVLLRALVGLETGGGNEFFGEPQFDIGDLMRTAPDGRGVISVLELPAVQDKPKLFSTALMWLLAELFEQLPEAGDLDKPKLVFFFDEAHLLFDGATKAFREAVTQTVRLIRSKGVGVFFVTQVPDDVPGEVLGQLGNRVQHALRAFTPDDAKALKAAASTYPNSRLLRRRGAAHVDGDRRGGRDDPVGRRRADARGPHAPAGAGIADRAGGRCRGDGEGLTPVRQVRHPRRSGERAREAARRGSTPRRSPPSRRCGAGAASPGGGPRPRRRHHRARLTSWATSWAPARVRRCSARSRAACSGC